MRLPWRPLWRTIPELNGHGDHECRRFVRTARRRWQWRWPGALLVTIVFLVAFAAVASLTDAFLIWCECESWLHSLAEPIWTSILVLWALSIVGVPLGAALAVRRWLGRRAILRLVRDEVRCPCCGHALAGQAVSSARAVACPECGEQCPVDGSLGTIASAEPGTIVGRDRRVIVSRPRDWILRRRRRWMRRGAVAMTIAVLAIGIPMTLHEFALRARAAEARREAPTAADATALIARHRPGMRRVTQPRSLEMIAAIGKRMDEIDARVAPTTEQSWELHQAFERFLAPDESRATNEDELKSEEKARELAWRLLASYEAADLHREIAALRNIPAEVRDLGTPPERYIDTLLPHLGFARRQARFMDARMLLAIERRDTAAAEEALESMLALGRACRDQPFLLETLVGWAIEDMAAERVKRWLASDPSAEELDAIERVWAVDDPAGRAALAIELESACMKALVATVVGQPSKMRFAPIVGVFGPFEPYSDHHVRHPGTWAANRDAIEAHRAAWSGLLPLEPFERAKRVLTPPTLPSADRAGLAALLVPALDRYLDGCDLRRTDGRVIPVLIALERWRLAHDENPESLAALVPELLPSVPIDPWSGAPMLYRRADAARSPVGRAFVLYSPGPDGRDDGGRVVTAEDMKAAGWFPHHRFDAPSGFDVPLNTARAIPRIPTE